MIRIGLRPPESGDEPSMGKGLAHKIFSKVLFLQKLLTQSAGLPHRLSFRPRHLKQLFWPNAEVVCRTTTAQDVACIGRVVDAVFE